MVLRHSPTIIICLILFAVNFLAWSWFTDSPVYQPGAPFEHLKGVSYSPFREGQHPDKGPFPTAEQIDEDMRLLAGKVDTIRTYGAGGIMEQVPAIAAKHGIKVMVGAWIGGGNAGPEIDRQLFENNEREVAAAIRVANANPNVIAVTVGNEVLYRRELRSIPVAQTAKISDPVAREIEDKEQHEIAVQRLAAYIDRVRAQVRVPVSTSETYDMWKRSTKLGEHTDFIAAHVLPYWEGATIERGVEHVYSQYYDLANNVFPDKKVMLAEVGWPSGGGNFKSSVPGAWNQEHFVRSFVASLGTIKQPIDYFVVEAFDQPWKSDEGKVGAHWGLYHVDRTPKFIWETPTRPFVGMVTLSLIASAIGVALAAWFSHKRKRDLYFEGRLSQSLFFQFAVSLFVFLAAMPLLPWYGKGVIIAWALMIPAMVLMSAIMLVQGYEFSELLWLRRYKRHFPPLPSTNLPERHWPKVSIQVACYNEPADMMIQTLNSLAALDYPDYEVLVVDNNTKDPAVWKPLEAHCKALGAKFKFFHLEPWPGFKAGALNFARTQTSPDAKVIAVLDADYNVETGWLKSVMPYFDNPKIGYVQCPQDNREWNDCAFKEMINWEYAGFFHLGMVHRNEYDAIIQHGTMTLVRTSAFDAVGGWSEWCIVEDAELGLRLMQTGWQSAYVNHNYGKGLVPDSFDAYKKQRFRWAYGSVMILRRHWKAMLPWVKSGLTPWQKYHFVAGWLPWFGDSMHLIFTLGMLAWTLGMLALPERFEMPIMAFILPAAALSLFNMVRSIWLYYAKVPCNLARRLTAAMAGMGLSYYVGRAMITGLLTTGRPFLRTPKTASKSALSKCLIMVRDEMALAAGLWAVALAFLFTRPMSTAVEAAWVFALLVQSLPFVCAVTSSVVAGVPAINAGLLRAGEIYVDVRAAVGTGLARVSETYALARAKVTGLRARA